MRSHTSQKFSRRTHALTHTHTHTEKKITVVKSETTPKHTHTHTHTHNDKKHIKYHKPIRGKTG